MAKTILAQFKTSFLNLHNKHVRKIDTDEPDAFGEELRLDVLAQTIKKIREEKRMTQAQLGKMVGVKKAQILKIENNLTDAIF